MAKVWFAREGKEPTRGGPEADLPITDLEQRLGLLKTHRIADPDAHPKFGDSTREFPFSTRRFVVVEIDDLNEAKAAGWEAGFYLLPLSADEAAAKLPQAQE